MATEDAAQRGEYGHGPSYIVKPPVTVTPTRYTVSRLPDDNADHGVWSVTVEASGRGRWAVRNMGNCLDKQGEWEHEPRPSSRSDEWLNTVRWDDESEAIAAAIAAEPSICWNGLTPADVLARRGHIGGHNKPAAD